jgi:ParB family transcriptional regulator, chromosome partitioning protein
MAASRGLGKGLSALISENYVKPAAAEKKPAAAIATGGITSLALTKLHSGKYQPRTHFDDDALADLTASIKKNGVMQPIVVRESESAAGKYEIVAGERRWRASKAAGLTEIPVIIRDVSDQQALELALIENIQRQDLNALEEASGYQRLIDEFNYTQEKIATTVGKSRSHIANTLRLLGLPDEIKTMVEKGELTAGHARALLNSPDPVALAREIVAKNLNVRAVEDVARKARGVEKRTVTRAGSPAPSQGGNWRSNPHKDPDILALEESLSENLGIKVSINDRGQSGEIVLAYDSLAQLDDILRRLGDNI